MKVEEIPIHKTKWWLSNKRIFNNYVTILCLI